MKEGKISLYILDGEMKKDAIMIKMDNQQDGLFYIQEMYIMSIFMIWMDYMFHLIQKMRKIQMMIKIVMMMEIKRNRVIYMSMMEQFEIIYFRLGY